MICNVLSIHSFGKQHQTAQAVLKVKPYNYTLGTIIQEHHKLTTNQSEDLI